jgi:hypothetical protein
LRTFGRYLGLALKYPFRLLSGAVLTLFALLLLGLNPTVQDFAGDRLAAVLSQRLRTVVKLDGLLLRTNGELLLTGFYLEDHYGDTLLYAEQLRLRIRLRPLAKQQIHFSQLTLDGLQLRLVRRDYEADFNFAFLLPVSDGDTQVDSVLRLPELTLDRLRLRNTRLLLHDYHHAQTPGQFNPAHLDLRELALDLNGLSLGPDSSSLRLNALRFREHQGLELEQLSLRLTRQPDRLRLDSLQLITRHSQMLGRLQFDYGREADLLEFSKRVRLTAELDRLRADPEELLYLTGNPYLPEATLYLRGTIAGRIGNLRSRRLELRMGQNYLRGEVNITGLPDAQNALYDLQLTDAYFDRQEVEAALPWLELPPQFDGLDFVQLQAEGFGYPGDFVASGLFTTNLGSLVSDLNLKINPNKTTFSGSLQADQLNLQQLTGDERLGQVSFNFELAGSGTSLASLESQLNGTVDALDFQGYRYHALDFSGYYDRGQFSGKMSSLDSNALLDFFGVADLNGRQPFYNFVAEIEHLDLYALRLSSDTALLRGNVEICLEGTNEDDVTGELSFRELDLSLNSRQLQLPSIELRAELLDDSSRRLSAVAPFGEATMLGNFSLREMNTSMERFFEYYLHREQANALPLIDQNFQLNVALHDAQPVADFLFPGRYQLDSLEGYLIFDAVGQRSDLSFTLPEFRADSLRLTGLNLIGTSDTSSMSLDLYVDSMFRNSRFVLHELSAEQTLGHDSLQFDLKATGDSSYNRLAIAGYLDARRDSLQIGFRPSFVELYGNRWVLEQRGEIWLRDSSLRIDDFGFRQAKQLISLSGVVSSSRSDSVYMTLSDVDLQQLNPILKAYKTSLEGFANINLRSSSVLRKPAIFGNIQLDEFVLDGQPIGNVEMRSDYSTELNRANVAATVVNADDTLAQITGYLASLDDEQDILLDVRLARSPIGALEKILRPAFDDVSGLATAALRLEGKLSGPVLTGYADLEKARMRVDFLNQYYNVNKRILFTENSIDFNRAELTDDAGGSGFISGKILHERFRRTRLDLRLDANNLLVLNTPATYDADYFGTGRLSGYATFRGPIDLVAINVVATAEAGTNFSIPLDEEGSRSETDFIVFVNKKDTVRRAAPIESLELTGVDFTMNITVTPVADLNIIFDRQTGDIIKGKGNGNIELKVNPQGDITMFGNFVFNNGDYTFTLANIANKKFRIAPGSVIRWSGDPYDAQLDVNAVYRQRASVSPLLPPSVLQANQENLNQYYNIDAYLRLAGSLLLPDISFQLKVPAINQNNPLLVSALNNLNNDEQRLNNQVIALLVAGQFIPEGDAIGGGFAASGSVNTVTELLGNQLSSLLSPLLGDNINVGLNYRNSNLANQLTGGTSATTPEPGIGDVNLAVNTTLFDNRVLIDGNIGNQTSRTAATQAPGAEVTIEYLVNPDGSLRIKGFNRLDDRIIFSRDTNYRQGIGLSYTRNYNSGNELKAGATRWIQDRIIRRIPWAPDSWKGDF